MKDRPTSAIVSRHRRSGFDKMRTEEPVNKEETSIERVMISPKLDRNATFNPDALGVIKEGSGAGPSSGAPACRYM